MKNFSGKISAVHLLNDHSGSPLIFKQSIEALIEAGYAVEIHTSAGTKGFLSGIPGASYRNFKYGWSSNKLLTMFLYLSCQARLFISLLSALEKNSIVYINTVLPFAAALAARIKRCKVVYHIHETSIKPPVLKKFLFGMFKLTASEVIYVSEYIYHTQPFNHDHSHIIYNSLSPEFVQKANQSTPGPGDSKTVLMLCSLKKYKGVPEFIELAKAMPAYRFELVLNATLHAIETFFENMYLPANLFIHPATTNVHPFYRHATVVVNLSRTDEWIETFGMTVLEAMAYGKPVIVPPVGGVTELVEHGSNGFLCNSRDTDLIKEYIETICTDRALYQRMSDNAVTMSSRFNYQTFYSDITGIFNFVAAGTLKLKQGKILSEVQ